MDYYQDNRSEFEKNRFGYNNQAFGTRLKPIEWNMSSQKDNAEFHTVSKKVQRRSYEDVKAFRKIMNITVSGKSVPNPVLSFSEGNFPPFIMESLESSGFKKPTPIQAQGWPVAFQGKNMIGVAETGSGKTLAFLIPAIFHILDQKRQNIRVRGSRVAIVSPTRELSAQIFNECIKLTSRQDIKAVCCNGGTRRIDQINQLAMGCDIVIGTPGRLIDLLEGQKLKLNQASMFIIDEADRMLDMGFEVQLRKIHSQIPPSRQTLLFTATWPREVENLSHDFVSNPIKINVGSLDTSAAHTLTQRVLILDRRDKLNYLAEEIIPSQMEIGGKVLVFVSTKKAAKFLYETMRERVPGTELLHGEKEQADRNLILRNFTKGKCRVLVATDVAQRGLDIPGITCVVNYDFPNQIEDYVHRIGRTGRAGKKGLAVTFLDRDNEKLANSLIKVLKEANQDIPEELIQLAEKGDDMHIERVFPKPWAERTDEEKEDFLTVPITMEQPMKEDEIEANDDGGGYAQQYQNNPYARQNNFRDEEGPYSADEDHPNDEDKFSRRAKDQWDDVEVGRNGRSGRLKTSKGKGRRVSTSSSNESESGSDSELGSSSEKIQMLYKELKKLKLKERKEKLARKTRR